MKRSAGILLYRGAGAVARAAAGASRRSVLGEQGRRRLVDPQRRIRRRARIRSPSPCASSRRSSGVRRRNGPQVAQISARSVQPSRQDHHRLRSSRRLRSRDASSRIGSSWNGRRNSGQHAILSRGRSRRSGSRLTRRGTRSCRARRRSSTACWKRSAANGLRSTACLAQAARDPHNGGCARSGVRPFFDTKSWT